MGSDEFSFSLKGTRNKYHAGHGHLLVQDPETDPSTGVQCRCGYSAMDMRNGGPCSHFWFCIIEAIIVALLQLHVHLYLWYFVESLGRAYTFVRITVINGLPFDVMYYKQKV